MIQFGECSASCTLGHVARHACNVYSLCLSAARTVQCWLGHPTLVCNGYGYTAMVRVCAHCGSVLAILAPPAEATQLYVAIIMLWRGDQAGPPPSQALREWLLAVLPIIYSTVVEACR